MRRREVTLPELHPGSRGGGRKDQRTRRAKDEVKRVLLSVDDRLALLHTSNQDSLRVSTTKSRENVDRIIRRHACNSELPRKAFASTVDSWLTESLQRTQEISQLEEELVADDPEDMSEAWQEEQTRLKGLHDKMEEAYTRLVTHVPAGRNVMVTSHAVPADEAGTAQLEENPGLELHDTDEEPEEEHEEAASEQLEVLAARCADLECDKRELCAVVEFHKRSQRLLNFQLDGARAALQAVQQQRAAGGDDLHEHGAHREHIERILAALPLMDSWNAMRRHVSVQAEPWTVDQEVQTMPVRTGIGQLLLCQLKRAQANRRISDLLRRWRLRCEAAWAAKCAREEALESKTIDPETEDKINALEQDLRRSTRESQMYLEELQRARQELQDLLNAPVKPGQSGIDPALLLAEQQRSSAQARTLHGKIGELEEAMSDQKAEASAERLHLQHQLAEAISERDNLKSDFDALVERSSGVIGKLKQEAELAAAEKAKKELEVAEHIRTMRGQFEKKISLLENQLKKEVDKSNDLLAKLRSQETKLKRTQQNLKETKQSLQESVEHAHALQTKVDTLEDELRMLKNELKALEAARERERVEAEQMEQKLRRKIKESDEIGQQLRVELQEKDLVEKKLRCQLAEAEAELEKLQLQLAAVHAELEHIKAQGAAALKHAQRTAGKALSGVLAGKGYVVEVETKRQLARAFRRFWEQYSAFWSSSGRLPVSGSACVGLVLVRWVQREFMYAIAQWRERTLRCRILGAQGLKAKWDMEYLAAKRKIGSLREQKAVQQMRASTLTSILCASSGNSNLDTSELGKMIEMQQLSVQQLSTTTASLDGICRDQLRALVQHILMLTGSRHTTLAVKSWHGNMSSEKWSRGGGSVHALLQLLRLGPHEQLANAVAQARYWENKCADIALQLKNFEQEAALLEDECRGLTQNLLDATDAGAECVKLVEVLQARVTELQLNLATSENSVSELKARCGEYETKLQTVQQSLAESMEQGAGVADAVRVKLEAEKEKYNQLKLSHDAKEAELLELRKNQAELLTQLKTQSATTKNELPTQSDDTKALAQLREELEDSQHEVSLLKRKLNLFEVDAQKLGEDIFECTAGLADAKARAEALEEERRRLAETLAQIEKLRAEGSDTQAAILQKEVETQKNKLNALEEEATKHTGAPRNSGFEAKKLASSDRARILGNVVLELLGRSLSVLVRLWRAMATEGALGIAAESFENQVDIRYNKDGTPNIHATGIQLLCQITNRMKYGLLQDYFATWIEELEELKTTKSLGDVKARHTNELERLQSELAATIKEMQETMGEADRHSAAAEELRARHADILSRHEKSKVAMLLIVLRHWLSRCVKDLLTVWKQQTRQDLEHDAALVSHAGAHTLALATVVNIARQLWRQMARWIAMQFWATQTVAEKQSRRLASASARLRQAEASADAAEIALEQVQQRARELASANEQLSVELADTKGSEQALTASNNKLKHDCDKFKRQLRICEDRLNSGNEKLSKDAIQQLIKLHGAVIKQYTTIRRALELGKLHSEGRGQAGMDDSFADTVFERAAAAKTPSEMLHEDLALVTRCTQGFNSFAAEVETARHWHSRRSPASVKKPSLLFTRLKDNSYRPGVEDSLTSEAEGGNWLQASQNYRCPSMTDMPTPGSPDFADWILSVADRHSRNGHLTVTELQAFLPNHPFTLWLTQSAQNLLRYDTDRDGVISLEELKLACADFQELVPSRPSSDIITPLRPLSRPVTAPEKAERALLRPKQAVLRPGSSQGLDPHLRKTPTPGTALEESQPTAKVVLRKYQEAESYAMQQLQAWSVTTPTSEQTANSTSNFGASPNLQLSVGSNQARPLVTPPSISLRSKEHC